MSEATLHDRLRALGLIGAADQFDDLVALATKKRWSPAQIFEHVADIEERERSRRGLERRLARSHLGRFKTIADYDWNWPTKIDRPLVESAVGLHFLGAARNVVLVAPQGLGKTMVAQNIGAGRWDRVDSITRAGVIANLWLTGVLVGIVAALDQHVLWLFLGNDAGSIGIATRINLLASWSFVLFGVSMVLAATARANGAVVGPLVILAVALLPRTFTPSRGCHLLEVTGGPGRTEHLVWSAARPSPATHAALELLGAARAG